MCRLITVHAAITAPHAYFAPRYGYFTGSHFLNLSLAVYWNRLIIYDDVRKAFAFPSFIFRHCLEITLKAL